MKWNWRTWTRKGIVLFVVVLGGLSLSSQVEATWSLSGAGGVNICLPNGGADCESIYPLNYGDLGIEYRFFDLVALGAHYQLAGLSSSESEVWIGSQQAVLMVRGYIPLLGLFSNLSLGAGMGFGELWASRGEDEPFYTYRSLFTSLRVDTALLMELPLLPLQWGPEFIWVGTVSGERCFVHPLGQSNCAQTSDLEGEAADVIDQLQIGVRAHFLF